MISQGRPGAARHQLLPDFRLPVLLRLPEDLRLPLDFRLDLRLLDVRLLDLRLPPLDLRLRELPRLVSCDSDRSLFTVRAAISSARSVLMPRRRPDALMCSYCRARLLPDFTPRGGISPPCCERELAGAVKAKPLPESTAVASDGEDDGRARRRSPMMRGADGRDEEVSATGGDGTAAGPSGRAAAAVTWRRDGARRGAAYRGADAARQPRAQ